MKIIRPKIPQALLAVFFALMFLFLYFGSTKAQDAPDNFPKPLWGFNGLLINNTAGNTSQQNPKVASADDGSFAVAWEDCRFGFSAIFVQKILSGGTFAWDANGIQVARVSGNQSSPAIIKDANNGMIIVWQDFRDDSADIYAQRVSPQGAKLWGERGIALCKASAGQFSPQIISDGAGGAIVVWHDYRGGGGEDIYAQRISADGTPLWHGGGIPICETNGTQWYPKICSDGGGGAIITWADGRNGSADYNIYAQRIDSSGKNYWEKNGIPICSASHNQERPEIIPANNGFVIAWQDARRGNLDIYAQKIDPQGQPLWESEGVAVADAPYSQEEHALSSDKQGGAIIIWSDNQQEKASIYMQKLTDGGKKIWGNGKRLTTSLADQKNPLIISTQNMEWLIVWEEAGRGASRLFAQKINSAGVPLWDEGGIGLAAGPKIQERACVIISPYGELAAVWQDRRGGNFDIYAQKASSAGDLSWGKSGLPVCNAPGSVFHQNPKVIDGGKENAIISWEDARNGFINHYLQKVGRDGSLLWGKDGIPAAKIQANQSNSQLVTDGSGGAILVWEDARNPNYSRIFTQRIASNGARLWGKGKSLEVARINAGQTGPRAVSDGAGGVIVVWEDARNPLGLKDLYGQRISGKGELLWEKSGVPLCGENGDQVDGSIASDGEGGFFIAWTDYRQGDRNPDIFAQRVNGNGALLWKKEGVLICGAPDIQRGARIISNGKGKAIIAWTDKGSGGYDIYAQMADKDGKTLWITDGVPVCQSARTQQNPGLAPPSFLVWEDYRNGNWDIFVNSLSQDGRLMWGEEGVSAASLPMTQYAPQIISWKNGGCVLAWEDYRNGKQYEVYLQMLSSKGKPAWQENGLKLQTSDGARAPHISAIKNADAFVVVWEDYSFGAKAIYAQKFLLE